MREIKVDYYCCTRFAGQHELKWNDIKQVVGIRRWNIYLPLLQLSNAHISSINQQSHRLQYNLEDDSFNCYPLFKIQIDGS